jgi:serine/threonine protein kinase
MKEIDHPNIVRLYEIVETRDSIMIAMEYCDGYFNMTTAISRKSGG